MLLDVALEITGLLSLQLSTDASCCNLFTVLLRTAALLSSVPKSHSCNVLRRTYVSERLHHPTAAGPASCLVCTTPGTLLSRVVTLISSWSQTPPGWTASSPSRPSRSRGPAWPLCQQTSSGSCKSLLYLHALSQENHLRHSLQHQEKSVVHCSSLFVAVICCSHSDAVSVQQSSLLRLSDSLLVSGL